MPIAKVVGWHLPARCLLFMRLAQVGACFISSWAKIPALYLKSNTPKIKVRQFVALFVDKQHCLLYHALTVRRALR